MSSSANRTSEFLTLAKSVPGNGSRISNSGKRPPPTTTSTASLGSEPLRSFHTQAAGISRDIANTSALLKELANTVRNQSSIFLQNSNDSSSVNDLVVRIKSAIENLKTRLETADRTVQQQKRALGKNSQAGQEAANLVSGLQSEFAEAASDFKKVLQQRTETMKETEDMQRQVYYNNGNGNNNNNQRHDMDEIPDMTRYMTEPPPVYGNNTANNYSNGGEYGGGFPTLDLTSSLMAAGEATGSGGSNALPRPHGIMNAEGGSSNSFLSSTQNRPTSSYSGLYSGHNQSNGSGMMSPLTPLDIQRMEQEQGDAAAQMLQLIPNNQSYLQTRAEAMTTVESNIAELGTIFNKLAGLIHEHGEMVQRVEDNVEEANTNIFLSMNVLTDTLSNLRSNRALTMRLFSILVVFIIFFIIFFA